MKDPLILSFPYLVSMKLRGGKADMQATDAKGLGVTLLLLLLLLSHDRSSDGRGRFCAKPLQSMT